MRRPFTSLSVGLVVALALPGVARADETPAQRADRLFNEGNALANAGDFAAACPRYDESNRLDRAIGTEFNLADCYQNVGKTATALSLFRSVEDTAKTAGKVERQNSAHQRAEALEKLVPRLRVTFPASGEVPGLEVSCDAKRIEHDDLGRGLAFDPGTHTVTAKAPARLPWSQTLQLVAGQTTVVAVPELAVDPNAVPPVVVRRGGTQRTLALITGGVGLAGLAVGTAFGVLSISDHSTASKACPSFVCTAASGGVSDWQNAMTAGNVSTAGFIVGGVVLAAGVTLFLTAPKDATREASVAIRPAVGPGTGSLTVLGSF